MSWSNDLDLRTLRNELGDIIEVYGSSNRFAAFAFDRFNATFRQDEHQEYPGWFHDNLLPYELWEPMSNQPAPRGAWSGPFGRPLDIELELPPPSSPSVDQRAILYLDDGDYVVTIAAAGRAAEGQLRVHRDRAAEVSGGEIRWKNS